MTDNDASFRIIADLLTSRTGQQLTESRRWRVSTALSGLFRELGIENIDQLACMLERPGEYRLATRVIEGLLNNETYFFRDYAYFDAVAGEVLPRLIDMRRDTRKLRIWSAGCSTGQEVLTLAMIIAARRASLEGWDIEILGTDISGKAIAKARRACYTQFEIQRGISVTQMLASFEETPEGWQAIDAIRRFTRFEQHSILDFPPAPGQFDLVLCRNVMLYFDTPTRTRAFERLAQATASDGWLMLGSGETVVGQSTRFEPAPLGASLYRLAQRQSVGARTAA